MDEAELSWKLADYRRRGYEAPDRVEAHPDRCEGEMMSQAEIEAYIDETLQALYIMSDQGSTNLERVQAGFLADLKFLISIGRLTADEYQEIIESSNEF